MLYVTPGELYRFIQNSVHPSEGIQVDLTVFADVVVIGRTTDDYSEFELHRWVSRPIMVSGNKLTIHDRLFWKTEYECEILRVVIDMPGFDQSPVRFRLLDSKGVEGPPWRVHKGSLFYIIVRGQ